VAQYSFVNRKKLHPNTNNACWPIPRRLRTRRTATIASRGLQLTPPKVDLDNLVWVLVLDASPYAYASASRTCLRHNLRRSGWCSIIWSWSGSISLMLLTYRFKSEYRLSKSQMISVQEHACPSDRARSIAVKDIATTPTCYLSAARASKRDAEVTYDPSGALFSSGYFMPVNVPRPPLSPSFSLFLGLFPLRHRAACSLSSLTQRGLTGARGGVFNGGRRGRGHPASRVRDLNAGSLALREKKKGWITATTQRDDRPYRRAGSPACTARVCRFSHRRTATAASPSNPSVFPGSLPLLSVCRDNLLLLLLLLLPCGSVLQRTSASSPEKAHLWTPPSAAQGRQRGAPRSKAPRRAAQSASPRPLAPPEGSRGPETFAPRPADAETTDRTKKLRRAACCRCVRRPLLLRARAARSKSARRLLAGLCDASGRTQRLSLNERESEKERRWADSTAWNRIYRSCRPPPRRVLRTDAINLQDLRFRWLALSFLQRSW